MASPFELAQRHIAAAAAEGAATNMDPEVLIRALLSTIIDHALAHHSEKDLTQIVSFMIENADPTIDYPFSRP